MTNNKPNIHLFTTCGGFYFYDVNTAGIVKVNESVYKLLKENKEPEADEDKEVIDRLEKKGFLLCNYPKEILHPQNDLVEEILEDSIEMMTLQLTQQCNFRCAYCPYTIGTSDRKHSNKKMTIETAKRGVDFLLQHSGNVETPVIGFYGGEPFLEYDMMKEIIEYATEKAGGKHIGFTVTTNGSMLTEDKVPFLEDHSVIVMISLDGPQEVHDKNRILASSGNGSFEKVINNVEYLYNKYPDFVKNNIQFNSVIDPVNDFGCFNEFFIKADFIKNSSLLKTQVLESKYTDYGSDGAIKFFVNREQEIFKLFLSQLDRFDSEKVSPLVKLQFEEMMNKMHLTRKPVKQLPEKAHPGGPCVPGCARIFLSTDGEFLPCEKVSETSAAFKMGDLDSGIDYAAARRILNIGKVTEENCKNCWVFTMCICCANGCEEGDEFSAKKKLNNCVGIKDFLHEMLINYCTLKELGCDYAGYGFSRYVEA